MLEYNYSGDFDHHLMAELECVYTFASHQICVDLSLNYPILSTWTNSDLFEVPVESRIDYGHDAILMNVDQGGEAGWETSLH